MLLDKVWEGMKLVATLLLVGVFVVAAFASVLFVVDFLIRITTEVLS